MKKIITKNIPTIFYKDGKFETPLAEFMDLLEELQYCDGLIQTMHIDKDVALYLEKKKIIRGQGTYAVEDNYLREKLLEEILELYYEKNE
jgi:hypothetical protein